jgi:hypothetical protein
MLPLSKAQQRLVHTIHKHGASVAKEHIVRCLSENSQDILCMKIDVHMCFKNPIAFKMFLSHAWLHDNNL